MADEETSVVAGVMLGELCTSVELESSRQNSPVSSLDYGEDEVELFEQLEEHSEEHKGEEDKMTTAAENNFDTFEASNGERDKIEDGKSVAKTMDASSIEPTNVDTTSLNDHATATNGNGNGNHIEYQNDDEAIDEIMMDAVDYADSFVDNQEVHQPDQPNGIHRNDTIGGEITDTVSPLGLEDAESGPEEPIGNDQEDEVEYVVERVMEKKLDSRGFAMYLVKWKGYPHSENTWEPLENLVDCEQAMMDFECRSAEKLAERHASAEDNNAAGSAGTKYDSNSSIKRKQTATRRRKAPVPKEFEVNDVMGLTMVDGEKYFLISLANSTQKTFIRASLANKVIPSKVIDFYIKSMRWKSSS